MAQATHITIAHHTVGRRVAFIVAGAAVGVALVAGLTLPATGGTQAPEIDTMSPAAQQAWADRYQGLADAFSGGVPVVPGTTAEFMMSPAAQQAWADRYQGLADASPGGVPVVPGPNAGFQSAPIASPLGGASPTARDAEAARWQALADHHLAVAGLSSARLAEAARWAGLAEFHRGEVVEGPAASFQSVPSTSRLSEARAMADTDRWRADAARWQGLADFNKR